MIELVALTADERMQLEEDQSDPQSEGNYILDELSLAQRVDHSARFTEKFRDNVVERIISNRTLVSKVCRELDITESDVQHWMKQWVHRRFELLKVRPDLIDQVLDSIDNEDQDSFKRRAKFGITVIEGRVDQAEP